MFLPSLPGCPDSVPETVVDPGCVVLQQHVSAPNVEPELEEDTMDKLKRSVKCDFPEHLGNYNRPPTDQPTVPTTNQQTDMRVIVNLHLQQ